MTMNAVITPIILLLFHRCPTHVAGFVVSVAVDSVKGVVWCRFNTKFANKFLKRCEAKFNPAPAVVWVADMLRAFAPLFSGIVCAVLSFCLIFRCKSVSQSGFICSRFFALVAPTRLLVSVSNVQAETDRESSANATTKPVALPVFIASIKTKDRKAVKNFSSQIYKCAAIWFERIERNVKVFEGHDVFSSLENILIRTAERLENFSRSVFILPQPSQQRQLSRQAIFRN